MNRIVGKLFQHCSSEAAAATSKVSTRPPLCLRLRSAPSAQPGAPSLHLLLQVVSRVVTLQSLQSLAASLGPGVRLEATHPTDAAVSPGLSLSNSVRGGGGGGGGVNHL